MFWVFLKMCEDHWGQRLSDTLWSPSCWGVWDFLHAVEEEENGGEGGESGQVAMEIAWRWLT